MSEIREILDKFDLEYYLDREGIEFKETHGSRGMQLNLRTCPVCGGDKWKVFFNAESSLGNCFSGSCESKFNKYSFIKAHTGLDGKGLFEHIKLVGEELGWRPPRKKSVAVNIKTKLVLPESYELPIGSKNLKYLTQRGIDADTTRYFNLRYSESGLFPYSFDGKNCYMDFSKRVIIPVFNLDGDLVSFQGRDITGTAEKKYLFPPGFASTGEHLFNGHNVHNTTRIVVGEGVFDVMAIKLALDADPDLRDVVPVGTFGKHVAEGQIQRFLTLKERGVTQITLMWDGELVALSDAIEAALKLRKYGFECRVARLPKDKDPNEVPAEVVRSAFWGATQIDMKSALRLKMSLNISKG